MNVSRLAFHALPGKTDEVEEQLKKLRDLVVAAGGTKPRILRARFASQGAPDAVFEEDVKDLATLDDRIAQVNKKPEFQSWKKHMNSLLREPPKREFYSLLD